MVDTGGIVPEDKAGIPGEILRQAHVAIENAARVVQVVDGREGPCRWMRSWRSLLRRAGKPPVLAVNKVDSPKQAELAAQFYELGDEIFPISAEHGFGIDTMLDALTKDFALGEAVEGQAGHQHRHHRAAKRGEVNAAESDWWARSVPSYRRSRAPRGTPWIRWSSATARLSLSRHRRDPPQG